MSPVADRATARALPVDAAPQAVPRRRSGAARLRLASVRAEHPSAASVIGTALLALLFLAVFGVVVFQALLVQTQSRLDQLERDVAVEQDRAVDLRLQLAERQSPERISAEAQDRLGMIAPSEVLYLQHDADDDAAAVLDPAEVTSPTPGAPDAATSPPEATP